MPERPQNPTAAALFILTATVFLAATTLLAKALGTDALGDPLHPMQVSHGRFLFAFMGVSTVALLIRQKITSPNWRWHLARTSCGWVGVTLMFAAAAFIPLSDATAISFLNPVFGMMLAIPLLGERVGPIRWLAAAIALLGALVLIRPTPASFQPAALLALGAAMVIGLELILIKRLSGAEAPVQILLINNMLGTMIATIAVLFVWQAPTQEQWFGLIALGLMMACAQFCFVNGMARADASFVAPFSYGALVFAGLYDLVIFDVVPDVISIVGAGIIVAGALLLALREARARRS